MNTNLNEVSKFILTQNPDALKVITKLISLLSDISTINTDIDNILYVEDNTDIDKFDNIINKLKSTSIEVIKRYGIILDNEVVYNSNLNWFYNIVYALQQFNNLNAVEYMLISDNLTMLKDDKSDNNIIDITYSIFKIVNPYIQEELFINNVSKVYIEFLNTFEKYINDIMINMEGSFEDDTEEMSDLVITLVNLFINNYTDRLPNIITTILETPIVLDMLVINGDNKYLTEVVLKLNKEYDKYDVLDYYIIKLLNGVPINNINSDILDIIDDESIQKDIIEVFNKNNIANELLKIHDVFLEGE